MFTDQDVAIHKGLMKLLDEATFPLKAREVESFRVVYNWAKSLPNRNPPEKTKKTKKAK